MRAAVLTLGSLALTGAVIGHAYYQKRQFYPSVVYLTKSNPSMAMLYLQAFVIIILLGKLFRKMFFGQLRPAEMEHLIERSWYAVTETCLAFTVFREDFSPRFVAMFTFLLFLKCFHWLGDDRVDYMERSPIITWVFHFRVTALLIVLGLVDAFFINHAYHSTITKGATAQLVFGFEYAILLIVVVNVFFKYILHSIDLQSENPWDNKAVYLLYTELFMGFFKVLLYMAFMAVMIKVHTFPLFAIRPMYLTMRAFKKALNDVIMSRRAIRNMNTLYPDATTEELTTGDNVCIICREEMVTGCKKLPCNHIFHTNCLRSWFQRQQTCPTCRMDILRTPVPTAQRQQQTTPQHQQQQQQQQQPNMLQGMPQFPAGFPMWMPPMGPGQFPMQPQQPQTPQTGNTQSSTNTTTTSSTTTQPTASATSDGTSPAPPPPSTSTSTSTGSAMPSPPATSNMPAFPPMMSPFTMFTPPFLPPPTPPPNFAGLNDEELRAMEGLERNHVEARIQCLRSIHTLLDAAMVQIQQYYSLMATLGPTAMQQGAPTESPTQQGTTTGPPKPQGTTSGPPKPQGTTTGKPTPSSTTKETAPPDSTTTDFKLPSPRISTTTTSTSTKSDDINDSIDELEGAVGFTAPVEQDIPPYQDDVPSELDSQEIRKRRIQRLESEQNLAALDKDDNTSSEQTAQK